jgi:hypothetical protein
MKVRKILSVASLSLFCLTTAAWPGPVSKAALSATAEH